MAMGLPRGLFVEAIYHFAKGLTSLVASGGREAKA